MNLLIWMLAAVVLLIVCWIVYEVRVAQGQERRRLDELAARLRRRR